MEYIKNIIASLSIKYNLKKNSDKQKGRRMLLSNKEFSCSFVPYRVTSVVFNPLNMRLSGYNSTQFQVTIQNLKITALLN